MVTPEHTEDLLVPLQHVEDLLTPAEDTEDPLVAPADDQSRVKTGHCSQSLKQPLISEYT